MLTNKAQFINLCLANKVLLFGDFVLKSGKPSHYFFNAGLFYTNQALAELGEFYADVIFNHIIQQNVAFDCLFGPAYKGIPIATTTAIALFNKYQHKTTIAFNRKEAKDHGEGGNIIGQDLSNKKVLLIDDVISAGTAIRESISILQQYNATIVALIIALDRQEPAKNPLYKVTSQEITAEHKIPVHSVVNFADIISYTKNNAAYNKYYELLSRLLA